VGINVKMANMITIGHNIMILALMQKGLIWAYHLDKSIQTITLLKYPAILIAKDPYKSINLDEAITYGVEVHDVILNR
jgi:hypothetical protein